MLKVNEFIKEALPIEDKVSDLFENKFIEDELVTIKLIEGKELANVSKGFDESCTLRISDKLLWRLKKGQSKLRIAKMGAQHVVDNLHLIIADFTGSISLFAGSSGTVVIGKCGQLNLDLRIGHDSKVIIGDKTTSNGVRIVAVNSDVIIGKDVMFSDGILIQGFDQHGIVDLATKQIVNNARKKTYLKRHCWIGRRAILMPGVTIGKGSIVGTGAVVTKSVEQCTAVAGVPARKVREKVSWCRPWTNIDNESSDFFATLD